MGTLKCGLVAVLLVAAALLFAACSSAKCGPSSCTGCCDQNGACQAGNTAQFCGADGGFCASCDGGSCNVGSCGPTPCSAANCTGCCAGTTCLAFNHQTDNTCGTGGAACHGCTAGTQTCQAGACVDGCGSNNCAGCCSTAGQCIPLNAMGGSQTTSQCGFGGAVCEQCLTGDVCSDDGLCVLPADGGTDGGATFDFPCGNNSPCLTSQACCSGTATGATFTCVDPASCPSGNTITCDGPEECPSSTPFCCGVENVNGGSSPNCTITQLGTSCVANCPFQSASNCVGTNEVVICHTSNDCTNVPNGYNECCQFAQGQATLTFCVTPFLAAFANQCF